MVFTRIQHVASVFFGCRSNEVLGLSWYILPVNYIFQFYDFHLICSYNFHVFGEIFICFKSICDCLLKHFYDAAWKSLSGNSSDLSCCWCHLIIFSHASSNFLILVWWMIFNCILDIWAIVLGETRSYINLLAGSHLASV